MAGENERFGFVAVIGPSNAGKSTLINHLVGGKVSIVTSKVQTTRARVLGIMVHRQSQIAFIDTPGIFEPKKRLDRAMVDAAWTGSSDSDLVLLMIDAGVGVDRDAESILVGLSESKKRAVLVLNKIDLVRPEQLLVLSADFNERDPFEKTFMISATKGLGVNDVLNFIADVVPEKGRHPHAVKRLGERLDECAPLRPFLRRRMPALVPKPRLRRV